MLTTYLQPRRKRANVKEKYTMFWMGCAIGAFVGFAVGVILAALLYIDNDK